MTLKDRYRRYTRLFPTEWRVRNEEALLATLLDAAEPDRDSVPVAEVLDLVRGAMVVRLRSRSRHGGASRLVRSAGAGAVSALAVLMVIGLLAGDVSADFVATSVVVAALPGTGVVYTVSSAIGGGWRRGLFAAVGCTFGIVPHVLAAMLGLSGIMQAGAAAFEVVRWAGVAYLVFMGVSIIRGDALRLEGERVASGEPMRLVVRRGILLNLLNPKLTVFFFAFLPQFLETPPSLLDTRLIGLGGVFMLVTLAVFAVYAGLSAVVRDRVLGAPAVLRWVRRSLGAVLVGFAARLAVTER